VKRRQPTEIPASPPADFPVYGLDPSWPGARWLDSFGDRIGDQVRWVRLAHQNPETGAVILVETHHRPLTAAEAAPAGERALRSASFAAAFLLVNLTLPADSVPRPPGLLHALVDHAEERSRQHQEWLPVSWEVDGVVVPARVWRFADGWAAFSDAVDGVYLAAASSGGDPGGLALARLADGRAYTFSLDEPLHPGVIQESSAAITGDKLIRPERQDWHPDQARLIAPSA